MQVRAFLVPRSRLRDANIEKEDEMTPQLRLILPIKHTAWTSAAEKS